MSIENVQMTKLDCQYQNKMWRGEGERRSTVRATFQQQQQQQEAKKEEQQRQLHSNCPSVRIRRTTNRVQ
ncbi:hypothetical protein ACLKA7_001712 [Drosophila subpalustris]